MHSKTLRNSKVKRSARFVEAAASREASSGKIQPHTTNSISREGSARSLAGST